MSLKFALLGLLADQPRHGYELKKAFEVSFSSMRLLNAGQIYTTLTRLTNEGLVTSETLAQTNAPARKVFSLTEAGRQALDQWLTEPVADNLEQVRGEFFLKLLVSALVAGSSRPLMIERQRSQLEADLARLRKSRLQLSLVVSPGETDPRPPAEQELSELRLLLLEGALLHLEADLTWLDLLATHLERLIALHN